MLCGDHVIPVFAATHRALPEFAPEGQVEFVQVVQVEEALAVMSQWKLRGGVMSQVAGFNHSVASIQNGGARIVQHKIVFFCVLLKCLSSSMWRF